MYKRSGFFQTLQHILKFYFLFIFIILAPLSPFPSFNGRAASGEPASEV